MTKMDDNKDFHLLFQKDFLGGKQKISLEAHLSNILLKI